MTTRSPSCSWTLPPGNRPTRIFGPHRSASTATGRSPAASRMAAYDSPWVWWSPWEKFRRKTSAPAAMSSRSRATDALAGPTVATIFVRRRLSSSTPGASSRIAIEPGA